MSPQLNPNEINEGQILVTTGKDHPTTTIEQLLKIWEYQVKWHEKNQRAFNSDLMIFVCNAWDQIEEDEEEDVLFSISNKLNETWKNYKDEQLMTLSARQEIASLRKGEKPSFKFDHLIKKISELVPGCLKVKIERHLRYVSVLSERLSELINIKIGQSVEVLENLYAEVKKMIRAMEKFGNMITNDDELKQNVFTHINEEYKELARKAREHLCRIDIKQKILQECEHADLSDFNVFEMLEKECVSLIYRNVEKEMNIWSKENNIGNRWREIKGRILEEIGGNENEQVTVVKFSAEYEGKDTGKKNDRHGEKDKNRWSVFTTGEKIALAAASPLVIPVTIVSSVPALLLGTVFMIHERTENSRKVQNFHEDRQAIMSTCLERMLEQFYSQDNISDRFERNYIRFYVENWDGIRKDLKVHYSRMEVSVKKASDDVDDASEKHDSLVKLAERISKKIHEINDFEIEFFQDK